MREEQQKPSGEGHNLGRLEQELQAIFARGLRDHLAKRFQGKVMDTKVVRAEFALEVGRYAKEFCAKRNIRPERFYGVEVKVGPGPGDTVKVDATMFRDSTLLEEDPGLDPKQGEFVSFQTPVYRCRWCKTEFPEKGSRLNADLSDFKADPTMVSITAFHDCPRVTLRGAINGIGIADLIGFKYDVGPAEEDPQ